MTLLGTWILFLAELHGNDRERGYDFSFRLWDTSCWREQPLCCGAFCALRKPGAVRGRLYDVGHYPALVRYPSLHSEAQEGIVIGEWFEVTEEGLKAMDILEDYY